MIKRFLCGCSVDFGMETFGYDLETSGTNPFKDKIITIQFRRGGQNYVFKIWDYENERDMILDFLNEWKRIPRSIRKGGDTFVVYNFKFDGPFLLTRCIVNKILEVDEWREYLWENIIHGPAFLDLYQLLGDKLLPFAKVRKCLVGSFGKYRSEDIPRLYKEEKYGEIEAYVNDELETFEKVYQEILNQPFFQELQKLKEELEKIK